MANRTVDEAAAGTSGEDDGEDSGVRAMGGSTAAAAGAAWDWGRRQRHARQHRTLSKTLDTTYLHELLFSERSFSSAMEFYSIT